MSADTIRAVVRLRTLGPAGLNPPQTKVLERLQTLTEVTDSAITELDIDIWGGSMGIRQTSDRDLIGERETIVEYIQWADEQGYTLQPGFEWSATDLADTQEGSSGRIVTPLITLAVYSGDRLQAVYPHGHVNDGEVRTIHDGVETLESMAQETEQSDDEQSEKRVVPAQ